MENLKVIWFYKHIEMPNHSGLFIEGKILELLSEDENFYYIDREVAIKKLELTQKAKFDIKNHYEVKKEICRSAYETFAPEYLITNLVIIHRWFYFNIFYKTAKIQKLLEGFNDDFTIDKFPTYAAPSDDIKISLKRKGAARRYGFIKYDFGGIICESGGSLLDGLLNNL